MNRNNNHNNTSIIHNSKQPNQNKQNFSWTYQLIVQLSQNKNHIFV